MFGMSQPGILPSYSDLDEGNKNAMVEFQSEGNGWEIEWEWWERILCKFTVYKELRIAETEQYISARRSSTSPESVLPPGDDAKFRTLRYERVHQQLQTEWNYVGVLLVALAGVDAATFAISPSSADSEIKTTSEAFSDTMLSESLFPINALARSAVSMSIIATALGLLFVTWFLLYYGWVDFETFFVSAL
ncbi:hypothetical protein GYMLUDRAFT_735090 [Collybiopsis luxurians FD-317 M1]|nr:hypothetical protein GYMLUDRAFT_735090 [Collybiopsis luxurians FD-317 M1]